MDEKVKAKIKTNGSCSAMDCWKNQTPTPTSTEAVLNLWRWLNCPDLRPIPNHLVSQAQNLSYSHCLEYFKDKSNFKIINLRAISEGDAVYLTNHGISLRHAARNLGITIAGRHFYSRKFQLTAIRERVLRALSPFNGRVLRSNQSMLASLNVVFYRFEDEHIFYVASAGIGRGFPKCALYFPQQDLIITSGEPWTFEKEDVIELQARMVSNAVLCCDYLLDHGNRGRKIAICLGFYHFAHHLWNELSGIYRLLNRGLLHKVDKYFVMREPLGALDAVFPEIPPEKTDRKDDTETLVRDILANRYFVIKVGDNYLSRELADRVYRVALKRCAPETIASVTEARRTYCPLLWVGIRVGNRYWVNQVDGLSSLIVSLVEKFPRLGVVFDGFSLPGDRCVDQNDRSDYAEIVRSENEVVTAVSERLRRERHRPDFFNIVGSSIFDANIWAHAIDFYLSPYGSVQHKVGWLTTKPGIIHTNRSLLKRPPGQVWIGIENAVKPLYINPSAIEDIKSFAKQGVIYKELRDRNEIGFGATASDERAQMHSEFDNYIVDWRLLREQLTDLMVSRQISSRFSLPALADWSLQRAVRTVQSIIDYVNV